MLDDLRNAPSQPYYEDGETPEEAGPELENEEEETRSSFIESGGLFLGMTSFQRFVIAFLLFMMTCLLGSFCLILSGKVILPFF